MGAYVVVRGEYSRSDTISVKNGSFWVAHSQGGGKFNVNHDWKMGVAAKDGESVARKEKIEVKRYVVSLNILTTTSTKSRGVELELRKQGGAVEAIHESLIHLKSRDEEHE